MPYTITTHPEPTMAPGFVGTSYTAATLDEAREACFTAMAETPRYALPEAARISAAIHSLGEPGGAIGPLPDGTVIEVKRVSESA